MLRLCEQTLKTFRKIFDFLGQSRFRKRSLIFLPGFLGCKEDWEEVRSYFVEQETVALDLPYEHVEEKLLEQMDPFTRDPLILVGYSMGGRIALHLQHKYPQRFEKVIVISAHPGIENAVDRLKRQAEDEVWIRKLETVPFEQVLTEWYNQPLFSSLKERSEGFDKMMQRRQQTDPHQWAILLRTWSVGRIPPLKKFSSKTVFLYGEKDEKYAELYRPLQAYAIAGAGHAAHLEEPRACAAAICSLL